MTNCLPHWWLIDSTEKGMCKKYGEVKQFQIPKVMVSSTDYMDLKSMLYPRQHRGER
jgi:hypothetical protein